MQLVVCLVISPVGPRTRTATGAPLSPPDTTRYQIPDEPSCFQRLDETPPPKCGKRSQH